MDDIKKITLEGKIYVWTGHFWYDAETYIQPPEVVIRRLNTLLKEQLSQEDANISDVHILLERASNARKTFQYDRAESLARQCLNFEPGNPAALAVLCAALRAMGQPQRALDETEAYSDISSPPLLTSRAAALYDLKRWGEAKRTVGRALAIRESAEAFSVMRRIKAERPDLYKN
jgi:tetratricopeptide (TPR) repeat protein